MLATEVSTDTAFLRSLPLDDGKPMLFTGRIRVERKLSEGKLSESYLGQHVGLSLPVIVRVMKPEITALLGQETFDGLDEACRRYARVRHESVTAIYDVGEYGKYTYAILEYVCGVPLLERIADRPLTEAETIRLFQPIALGLAALWRGDFLHRGVSPLRVLIDPDGVPKLDVVILPRVALEKTLVDAHKPFMAGFWPPEELKGSLEIDPRSDIFSFGASMYFAVTGVSPFGAGTPDERIKRTLERPPTDIIELEPNINADFRAFVMRCLKCEPKDRFDSIQHFLDSLEDLQAKITNTPLRTRTTFGPGILARKPGGPIDVGSMLGQCVLEAKVGAGAFGIVYRGRHRVLDIPMAVKLLPTDLASRNPDYIGLFLREARTAIRIRHRNVIGLFEAGEEDGQYYLTMEFAPGGTVLERLRSFPNGLPEADVARMLRESALGLAAAQEMNIVHRDIKPANLMYGAQDEIKIADLGLAKRLPGKDETPEQIRESIKAQQLTMMRGGNSIQGTPAYMAPETATRPDTIDHRADLYSLGVTAYHALTGKLPFEGRNPLQVMVMHATQPVPPPRSHRQEISEGMEAVVMRLLEKTPEKRYQSPQEVAAAVEKI